MRFDAIAFDLDGTLYPNPRLYLAAFPGMARKARRFLAFNAARHALRKRGAELPRGADAPADGPSFRAAEAALVAERLGIEADSAAALVDREFYDELEGLFARVRPYRGLKSALNELARAGLRLALLSDLPPKRKLALMGLSGFFEVELCSEDTGFLKPAAEPFAMLASSMGLPPERILYVGNSSRIDVRGAKAAGMSAALISLRASPEADLSFYDWRKLVAFALS
jgi:putative hydrolase of the HAD superfamily